MGTAAALCTCRSGGCACPATLALALGLLGTALAAVALSSLRRLGSCVAGLRLGLALALLSACCRRLGLRGGLAALLPLPLRRLWQLLLLVWLAALLLVSDRLLGRCCRSCASLLLVAAAAAADLLPARLLLW